MNARTSSARRARGNPDVVIFMGSDSDWAVMAKAAAVLEEFGIPHLAIVSSAQRALSGTKRVALRATDARWSNELTRTITRRDIAIADDADVVVHFDGALEHLGRGRKRRSATASITKGGRTVFRYELKPEEYRVGDDPAEAFARILGDVLR